jgi:hypothetical protein
MPPAVDESYICASKMDEMQLQAIDCEHLISIGTELATLAAQFPYNSLTRDNT